MLDSGAQVSAVPRRQIDELPYNLGPSNVTGLKGISGEDIPRYGHVELNLRRVQVGAEVADIEHGIIATDAIVKRGRNVFAQPGRTLDCGRSTGTTITDHCNQVENASSRLQP